jgi:RING-variant domain
MTQKDEELLVEKPAKKAESLPETPEPDIMSPESAAPFISSMTPPSYETLDRGMSEETKTCRICLEPDHPEDMIAPCRCKGGSRWVHRQCLDEWRIHETDRAFAKCTECLFKYHLEQTPNKRFRKTKYYLMVTRDLCGANLLLQLIIAGLGYIASLIDSDRMLPQYINADHPAGVYYLTGFLSFLCLLGVLGSMMVCSSGCSVKDALEGYPELHRARYGPQPSYGARSTHYQARRAPDSGHPDLSRSRNEGCTHCCWYYQTPYYYGSPGTSCDCCCWCCNDQTVGVQPVQPGSSQTDGCDCCPGGDSGDGNGGEILMIILLVLAVVMAVIGFVVGMIVVVVIFQRSVQRHAYLIHKHQLTKEFQVMDLSKYDLTQPLGDGGTSTDDEEAIPRLAHPPPSAPVLPEEDAIYLKKMGLLG